MSAQSIHISLPSPEATTDLARKIGALLVSGDTCLLQGDIGAGKTHFARSLIQSRLTVPEDIPSPTFTLVQTYQGDTCEIWHADLYRLTSPDETVELGLIDAFETAICLVEWPDRLAELAPDTALTLDFTPSRAEDTRELTLSWTDPDWPERLKGIVDV